MDLRSSSRILPADGTGRHRHVQLKLDNHRIRRVEHGVRDSHRLRSLWFDIKGLGLPRRHCRARGEESSKGRSVEQVILNYPELATSLRWGVPEGWVYKGR